MRNRIGVCAWVVLLAAGTPASASDEAERAPGQRLRLEFREVRQRGELASATRPSALVIHADAGQARLFVGTQLSITQQESGSTTTTFKNAGVAVRASLAALPDGGYRLDAEYEDSQKRGLAVERAPGPVTGGNPVLQVVKARSQLVVREGESVPFASAVDPVTGELVRVELTLSAAPPPRMAASTPRAAARLRAQLVLTRRQGQTTLARRPYSVLVPTEGEAGDRGEVFSGSQLPVQTRANDRVTVALKDVGAGLKLGARRAADGRYRLEVQFSDGVLSAAEGAPELRVFQSESLLLLRVGETVTVASSVDPQTGEVVEAELTLEAF